MTMSHQKHSNKSYLDTARNARTKGSTTSNQHFYSKTGNIRNLPTRSAWLLRKKVNTHGTSWGFLKVI